VTVTRARNALTVTLRLSGRATDTAYPLRALDPTESILPRDVVALTLAHRILAP
jgi:hypothetical protein